MNIVRRHTYNLLCFDSGRLVSITVSHLACKDPCLLELFLEYSQ
jgi:hypothetical protein